MPHANDNTVQVDLLNRFRKMRTSVSVYLTNGIRLSGVTIESFDAHVVALKRNKQLQLVQKSAISTVLPEAPAKALKLQGPANSPLSDQYQEDIVRPVAITIKRRIPKAEAI
jgi:host factor-I protein